ncbi:hypothetical protein [Aurantiacibacter hainanensis]|uniref:hypothetical protein n=1 Tax=Aurantiacibacter hainanensis TaxID=3076114 RepID=UPI0030C69247
MATAAGEAMTAPREPTAVAWRAADSRFWPLAMLGLLAALQFTMIFTRAINWDEYSYFREVVWFSEGRLDRTLQTFHVRLFAWLPSLFGTSTDHVVAARVAMFGFELVTLGSLYLVARRFVEDRVALLAPLTYLSAGMVMQHGFSFRVDPIATALLCASLAVLASARLRLAGILAFGLFAGLAAMVTIKVALYLPAFLGLAWWRAADAGWSRTELARIAACPLAALGFFAALYAYHATGVTAVSGAGTDAGAQIGEAGNYSFFLGIPLYWQLAIKAAASAPAFTVMIAVLPFMLLRSERGVSEKAALLGLWLPISTIAFYTNTLPYFYAFILAPLAIAVVPALEWLVRRYDLRLVAIVLALLGTGIWLTEDRGLIDRQRQIERNVHAIFPAPVTYFDHNYMLGGWPKANGFMTLWGLQSYRMSGEPRYRKAMERETVPLFLANYPELDEMISGRLDGLLLAPDEQALRDNYIEFSWPIWIAGKDFSDRRGSFVEEFLVPGPYTVEGGDISIDGRVIAEGAVVTLERGDHAIELTGEANVRLVWGERLQPPAAPVEPGPIYALY